MIHSFQKAQQSQTKDHNKAKVQRMEKHDNVRPNNKPKWHTTRRKAFKEIKETKQTIFFKALFCVFVVMLWEMVYCCGETVFLLFG